MGTGITEGDRWSEDESGTELMPRKQAEYLEALLDGTFATEAERCAALGITPKQGRRWRANPRFRAEHERRANERMVSADRIHAVVDVLYDAATKLKDVGAAKHYLQYVEKFLPSQRIIQRDRELEHYSDDELEAEIQRIIHGDEFADDDDIEFAETALESAVSAFEALDGADHWEAPLEPVDSDTAGGL